MAPGQRRAFSEMLALTVLGCVAALILRLVERTFPDELLLQVEEGHWADAASAHVLGSITREFNDKGIDALLALDLPRSHYILGKLGGFLAIAAVVALITCVPLLLQTSAVAVLQWSVALALERRAAQQRCQSVSLEYSEADGISLSFTGGDPDSQTAVMEA